MKRKILFGVFFSFLVFCLLISNKSLAVVPTSDYTIKNYNIDVIVNENNTFDITETITAYFNVPKHGIFRKIPTKNEVVRADGTTSNNSARITNISVDDEEYTTYGESGYRVIKIGDADETLTGSHTYIIKYKYNIGKDPLKDKDELYFNLIGNEWDAKIEKVSFNIMMPKPFDAKELGFSTGLKGSEGNFNVDYKVSENNIIGSTKNVLNAGEGITIRLTLPEDYFQNENLNIDIVSVSTIIFCIVCIIIAYIMWAKYGKDDVVVDTVEFYPPEGYNSAEIGFISSGKADNKGVISLLIYLANKGYLKIEETGEDGFLKKKKVKIIKLKEYDGDNELERTFFEDLFYSSSHPDYVNLDDLYNRFYLTIDKIKSKLNRKENKNQIFEGIASSKIKYLVIMCIIIFLMVSLKPAIEYGQFQSIIFIVVFVRSRLLYANKRYFRLNEW